MKKYLITAVIMLAVLFSISAYAATVTVTDGDLIGAMEGLDFSQDNTVILASDVVYGNNFPKHTGRLTIKGNTATRKFSFTKDVQLFGPTTFDNLVLDSTSTLYAAGFHLIITDTVTTTSDMTIYGGKYATTMKSTNLEIYGGNYKTIYGGGQAGGTITGDTHVTVGGKVNSNKTTDDGNSSFADVRVYGGGNGAAVNGNTYITYKDNAIFAYIFGAGNGTAGTVGGEVNIYMQGGKVMNLYGGAHAGALTCNSNIYMTGGLAEAVIGGSHGQDFTGNTNIYLLGGDISRRVYTGCYDANVVGTSTIVISDTVALCTGTELSSGNNNSKYVYLGSNGSKGSSEKVILVYANDSYSKQNGHIYTGIFTNNRPADYTVQAGKGGMIYGANEAGKIKVVPDSGKYATVNNQKYYTSSVALSSSSTNVTFGAVTLTASKATSGISVTTNVAEPTITGVTKTVFVAVYNPAGKMVGYAYQPASTTFEVACDTSVAGTYTVKAMVVDSNCSPLTDVVSTTVAVA